MSYTQIIEIDGARHLEGLRELIAGWDADQRGVAPGYLGARLLADQDATDRYLLEVDFSSPEEAARNNDRQETVDWARQLRALVGGEPTYRNLEPVYTTE